MHKFCACLWMPDFVLLDSVIGVITSWECEINPFPNLFTDCYSGSGRTLVSKYFPIMDILENYTLQRFYKITFWNFLILCFLVIYNYMDIGYY